MRLLRLRLQNFRQHRDTDLEFGPGLTGIIGMNGAGKSTLLEAIAWAIYGMEAARGTRDSIRWRRAKARSEVRVDLEFGLGAHEYRVSRTLYDAELFLDGGEKPIATSLQEVAARLTRVLGMTHQEFFTTYFTGQKELALMAAMKPTERGQFLARLLGYDKLRMAQEAVRARRNELKGELAGLEQGWPDPGTLAAERERRAAARESAARRLAGAEEQAAAARAASDRHLPVFREFTELKQRHQALVTEKRVAEERVRQVVELVRLLDVESTAASRASQELATLGPIVQAYQSRKADLAELDLLARDAERRAALEAQAAALEQQKQDLERRLAEARRVREDSLALAERLEADRRALEESERRAETLRSEWVRELQDAQSKRDALLEQYRDLATQRQRIVVAGEAGTCPTCGRPLGPEFMRSVVELLDTQLAEVTVNGRYFKARIEQIGKEPTELVEQERVRRELSQAVERGAQALAVATGTADGAPALEREIGVALERAARAAAELASLATGYDPERHEALRRGVAELEPKALQAERLATDAARAPRLLLDLRAAEARRAELIEALARHQRELGALPFTEEAYQGAEQEMQRLEDAWRRSELDVAVARAELAAATDKLREAERAEQESAARAARAALLQADFRLHNELDRALGDLRLELNQEMRPELAALAAEFLSALTDGRYDEVELDEHYEVTVLEEGEPQTVISGGEEDLTNLVLRFAVSQMIAERSGQPLTLLILDEIFGSLDETRRSQVVALLRALEARFPQVVLITHVEGVRESLDRVLRVRFDEASGSAVVAEERALPPGLGGADADVAA